MRSCNSGRVNLFVFSNVMLTLVKLCFIILACITEVEGRPDPNSAFLVQMWSTVFEALEDNAWWKSSMQHKGILRYSYALHSVREKQVLGSKSSLIAQLSMLNSDWPFFLTKRKSLKRNGSPGSHCRAAPKRYWTAYFCDVLATVSDDIKSAVSRSLTSAPAESEIIR